MDHELRVERTEHSEHGTLEIIVLPLRAGRSSTRPAFGYGRVPLAGDAAVSRSSFDHRGSDPELVEPVAR